MLVPVAELVLDFVKEAQVGEVSSEGDLFLQGLIDDFQSSSAMFKRDMRRLMEKDSIGFLKSACRILKASSAGPGAAYLMETLWSSPALVASLADPSLLTVPSAIRLAKTWMPYDSRMDIKLLHIGFPSDAAAVGEIDIARAKRVLAILNELPTCRHILLPLVNLLHSPDPKVRSKATTLYGRTSRNPAWVHKNLVDNDPRVRANAVESLWGADSTSARAVLREATRDRHHRVAANALIGLHYMGGYDAAPSVRQMAGNIEANARAAAAFAMGQIRDAKFKPDLETLLKDNSSVVRGQALRALVKVNRGGGQAVGDAVAAPDTGQAESPQEAGTAGGDPAAEPAGEPARH